MYVTLNKTMNRSKSNSTSS